MTRTIHLFPPQNVILVKLDFRSNMQGFIYHITFIHDSNILVILALIVMNKYSRFNRNEYIGSNGQMAIHGLVFRENQRLMSCIELKAPMAGEHHYRPG